MGRVVAARALNGARPAPTRAGLACLRERIYRLLSQTLLYPEDARIRGLADAAETLFWDEELLARFAFHPVCRRLRTALLTQRGRPAGDLQTMFVRLFSAGPRGVPCPPYESAYRNAAGRADGWLLAEVEAAYAVAGVGASPVLGELPDHVAVELEFLAVLCGREADAWERAAVEVAAKALSRQQRFLRDHLSRWLSAFARRVARAAPGSFYATVSACADDFVAYDADLVELLRTSLLATGVRPEEGPS